jgi:hypothetical protein
MHFPLKWPEGYKSRVDSAIGTTQRKFKDDPYKMLERVRDGMDAFVGIALEARIRRIHSISTYINLPRCRAE